MDFKDLTEAMQAEALNTKLSPTEVSVWRGICRSYSKLFHTPLEKVMDMDPEHVILNVYEDQLEDVETEKNLDRFLDIIYRLKDPKYDRAEKEEIDKFAELAEKEEEERLKTGKPVKGQEKTLDTKKGFLDLSHLEKMDKES